MFWNESLCALGAWPRGCLLLTWTLLQHAQASGAETPAGTYKGLAPKLPSVQHPFRVQGLVLLPNSLWGLWRKVFGRAKRHPWLKGSLSTVVLGCCPPAEESGGIWGDTVTMTWTRI